MSSSAAGSTTAVSERLGPTGPGRLDASIERTRRDRAAVPPPPTPPAPAGPLVRPRVDPPVWSVAPPTAPDEAPPQPDRALATRRAGSGLIVALELFYGLQLLGGLLAWQDAEIRTPGQSDLIVGYTLCCVLLASAFLWRGRWRALPVALGSLAGAAVPLGLSRDLLQMLGIPDVWIGQSMTLHVLFPLVVGGLAVVVLLVRGSRAAR